MLRVYLHAGYYVTGQSNIPPIKVATVFPTKSVSYLSHSIEA